MKHCPRNMFYKKPLAACITAALMSVAANNANAANFQLGNFDVSFDSTFTVGGSWRVENRNWNDHVGKSNNLESGFDFSNYQTYGPNNVPKNVDIWKGQGGYSTNGDNGNLNYDAGEAFSKIFKGSHELDIKYDNVGVFVRGMYYYDFAMMQDSRAWTNPTSQTVNDPCRDSEAKKFSCTDVRLLDAFVYGDFDLGDMPLSVRVGQQVISWGESTLISHGISELNPVDIARLRAPGSELKEAFIPFGAAWASLGLTENVNIEAFYQYSWEKTRLPSPGSYFSTNDFAGAGGQYNNVQLGFAGNPDIDLDFLLAGLNEVRNALLTTSPTDAAAQGAIYSQYMSYPTKVTLRGPANEAVVKPKDGGQYGLRLSWYLPELNDTELSFYHMNYHSRRPLFSGVMADFTDTTIKQDLGYIAQNEITAANYTDLGAFSKVQLVYPEDIKLYAMSFNTVVGTTSVAGELTFRQDEPLQIDDVELLFAAMPQQLAHPDVNPAVIRTDLEGISQMGYYDPGATPDGFVLSDTVQAQMTLTHLFGPSFGASQMTGLLEVGGININDMPDPDVLRLNGPGTARNGGIPGKEGLELGIQGGVETNPFPTEFAWGYRLVGKLDYSNVFAGVNVSPRIVFSHDVEGTTPDPLFLFIEKRKSVSMGVNFDYQSKWSADFTYNNFFDGVGTTNQIDDRDYISFNIKYSI